MKQLRNRKVAEFTKKVSDFESELRIKKGKEIDIIINELYRDKNFTEKWYKSSDAKNFELQRVGTVGITADAKVNLTVNEDIPEILFYRLEI